MLDHLLPEVYVNTMRNNLLDKCPVSSWKSVSRTIREDLGREWDEMFENMERIPVASASLAQVHRATDKTTGRKLAVKVQHEDLRETSSVDLVAIEGLVKLVRWLAPEADYTWLTREANENLPRELDFRIEAENAMMCKQMVESSKALKGRVDVPDVDLTRTSARVLTMEWIDGVGISDKAGLKALGCKPKSLARVIATCFSQMIYRFGNVHADPHIANMLVRKTPSGSWQLVLLDHGLYRRLDDEFRLEYSKLWKALILGDVAGITESATKMNAADSVPLFAGMLTQRQWRDVTKWEKGSNRLKHDRTEKEKEEIQEFVGQHAQEIGILLGKLPRELLLLLKTNDCLRSVVRPMDSLKRLHASTHPRFARSIPRTKSWTPDITRLSSLPGSAFVPSTPRQMRGIPARGRGCVGWSRVPISRRDCWRCRYTLFSFKEIGIYLGKPGTMGAQSRRMVIWSSRSTAPGQTPASGRAQTGA